MRVEIARQTYHQRYGRLEAGAVVDVPDDVGQHWLASGIAKEAAEVIRVGEAGDVDPDGTEPEPESDQAETIDRDDADPLTPEDVSRAARPGAARRRTRRA